MSPSPSIDPDFAAYLRHRDEGAFRRLVDTYLEMVGATAVRTCPHLAEDVVQAVRSDVCEIFTSLPRGCNMLHRERRSMNPGTITDRCTRVHRWNQENPMTWKPASISDGITVTSL